MTELNGTSHFVQTVNATAVNVFTDSGLSSSLDGTGFGAYVSGGTAIRELVGTSMTGGTIKIPSPTTTIKNNPDKSNRWYSSYSSRQHYVR